MSELKPLPCPFCGGKARAAYAPNDYNRWGVECKACGATVEVDDWLGAEDTQENAIVAWNRRHQPNNEPRSLEEWTEDDGNCLWWEFPIEEPPYCGSPLDLEWPGYHTYFTKIVCPEEPEGGEG